MEMKDRKCTSALHVCIIIVIVITIDCVSCGMLLTVVANLVILTT